ncbi:thioredoxin-like domain-containing protein [Singulisphaera acidiphila]|uniref:Thiol-disulfide isomerase-like thioredoxin n=1 Tax=Singulisphaera acidiphila (strain ATCC BAA-1392 / DSM 18658 / VKM B-2454 / MOB10) TaxID=886293 RepID=L0DB17_SINAD|nr:thioredoxin-like domain-containing protein [Singulisphaera acidiphila]AGA25856.1 thiol-disulfide isomerase-like thioredoxin [Singulisphaera acidiphila DSM 18658]
MRSLRTLTVAAGLLGMTPFVAMGQSKTTPEALLNFKPSLRGVEYEAVTDPAAINACKVEAVTDANKQQIGFALRDGQGKLLRKFLDTDGNRALDQWSYYQDGFEVYRENDLNNDRSLDECRWLNSAGTRIATVKSIPAAAAKEKEWKVQITGWKRLSAEEASKVFVQGLVWSDMALMETVLATPEELASLGIPQATIKQISTSASNRVAEVKTVLQNLKGWNSQTTWSRLDGMMPHLIPADPSTSLKQDLILYENAVIFPASTGNQANPANMAFLQVPEMIKLGDVWKFVELPRAVDPSKPLVASEGGIRSSLFQEHGTAVGGAQDPEVETALKALATYDEANASAESKTALAQFHRGRIPLLQAVIKVAKTPEDRLIYNKQIVDSLAAAYQTGLFAAGLSSLDKLVESEQGSKLGTYAAFRKIFAEFAAKNDEGGNVMANQKKWMAELKDFVDKNPKAEESPDALLQLASAHEYNAEEDEAKTFYNALTRAFADTDQGRKAAGALKRLDLVGKPLDIKGQSLSKETIDTSKSHGKVLLVTFWATWADPVKKDLPELVKLYNKHHDQGLDIVGICLDEKGEDLEEFLKANPLPWSQIYEPGGLEKNPFASSYGIIALPTMILVDSQGKVVNRSIRTAAELEKQLEKLLTSKDGVALGAK